MFLSAVLTFLLTMWAIYTFLVLPYNAVRARMAKPVAEVVAEPSAEEKLLLEIRDPLKNRPL